MTILRLTQHPGERPDQYRVEVALEGEGLARQTVTASLGYGFQHAFTEPEQSESGSAAEKNLVSLSPGERPPLAFVLDSRMAHAHKPPAGSKTCGRLFMLLAVCGQGPGTGCRLSRSDRCRIAWGETARPPA